MPDSVLINNITKTYRVPSLYPWKKGEKTEALINVSFTCPAGAVTCILGPNGAGKTTIIKILAGLILPDNGSITVSRHGIGMVTPNERSFYWRLTGKQNLYFYAALHGLRGKEKRSTVENILKTTGLTEEADKPFRLYSAGMKQRLNLGRALLGNPDVLLLDEPTNHIDPLARESIHKLITEELVKDKKTTVLLCTHNLDEAQKLADHLILLDKGRVIAEGNLNTLRAQLNPYIVYRIAFIKNPIRGWEKKISGTVTRRNKNEILVQVSDKKNIAGILETAMKKGGLIQSCGPVEEPLLDIMTRLTGEGTR